MSSQKITLLGLLAAMGYLVFRRYTVSPAIRPARPHESPVAPVVETVLHEHLGEDSPIVHAFETALEEARHHEEQLEHETSATA